MAKNNREDTLISQDAAYFLNAIRNGEQSINYGLLTNYVQSIQVISSTTSITNTNTYTNPNFIANGTNPVLINDANIIGLLSTPEFDLCTSNTNTVTAIVSPMSGSAILQNPSNSAVGLTYQLTVEIDPWNFNTGYIPLNPPGNPNGYTNFLANNLHEIRLKFAWPVLPPNNNLSPTASYQTYRSLICSHLLSDGNLWFFEPQFYTNNLTGP